MNTLDKKYQDLLQDILDNGIIKQDRTGTGTTSVFGRQIRHKMSEGFPLLTTKKMAWKTMVTELLWFLRGDTSIKYLVDNNCHIWDGDCFANYVRNFPKYVDSLPENSETEFIIDKDKFINKIKTDDEFAKKWGSLGKIYGYQWRNWGEWATIDVPKKVLKPGIDQIQNLINDIKTNPDSRRLLVSAWNPADLDSCVLPPCHYSFQVYTRELSSQERKNIYDKSSWIKDVFPTDENGWNSLFDSCNIPTRAISLMFNMRSNDVGLGLSFNLSSYALLLMMIAKQVNMVPDELIYNGGDVHLYLNHIEPIKEQLTREPYPLPTVKLSDRVVNDISEYTLDDIVLENYQSHPSIKMTLSN
jgi:thymidylate synthase